MALPLWAVYLAWPIALAILFGPCWWLARQKQRNKSIWLSYL